LGLDARRALDDARRALLALNHWTKKQILTLHRTHRQTKVATVCTFCASVETTNENKFVHNKHIGLFIILITTTFTF